MTGPLRWVFTAERAHVLADGDAGHSAPVYLTVCGLGVPAAAAVYSVPPSLDVCRACVPLPGDVPDQPPRGRSLDVPPPLFQSITSTPPPCAPAHPDRMNPPVNDGTVLTVEVFNIERFG